MKSQGQSNPKINFARTSNTETCSSTTKIALPTSLLGSDFDESSLWYDAMPAVELEGRQQKQQQQHDQQEQQGRFNEGCTSEIYLPKNGNDFTSTFCDSSFSGISSRNESTADSEQKYDQQRSFRFYGTVGLLGCCTILLSADQNLMSPNLTAIGYDLGIYDPVERDVKLGGNIAFAFFMVGAPASLLYGFLTDLNMEHNKYTDDEVKDESQRNARSWCFWKYFLTGVTNSFQKLVRPNHVSAITSTTATTTTTMLPLVIRRKQHNRDDIINEATARPTDHSTETASTATRDSVAATARANKNKTTTNRTLNFRTMLFVSTVFIGEIGCFLTGFVTSYWQLLLCRAMTGFGMGGSLPILYSLLGDWFRPEERHFVNSMLGIGNGIGVAFGQGIAGMPMSTGNGSWSWRIPFFIVSIPALVLATIVACFVTDPVRGGMEPTNNRTCRNTTQQSSIHTNANDSTGLSQGVANAATVDHQPQDVHTEDEMTIGMEKNVDKQEMYLYVLLSTPSVCIALLQGGPGCVPWGIISTYLNDYLSTDHGMSVPNATFVVLLFGIGVFFGQVVSGTLGSYLYRIDVRYPQLLSSASLVLSATLFIALIQTASSPITATTAAWDGTTVAIWSLAVITGIASGITGPIIKATLQNVTSPSHRGRAFALFNIADDLGRGIGPVFVAMLIRSTHSRPIAFTIGTCGWYICAVLNGMLYCFVQEDEKRFHRDDTTISLTTPVTTEEQLDQPQQQQTKYIRRIRGNVNYENIEMKII